MRRWRRGGGGTSLDRSFRTRLESAQAGLHFEAHVSYAWEPTEGTAELLYGDEVARTLLTAAVADAAGKASVLLPQQAEDAANARLSERIRTDERLVVSGRVRLTVPEPVTVLARRREQAAEEARQEQAVETARLELLRERLLDRRLGPVWWLDRYADLQFATGDPEAKVRSVTAAFDELAARLRRDVTWTEPDEAAVLRARAGELLSALEDPATRKRTGELLDTVLRTLQPSPDRQTATRTAV